MTVLHRPRFILVAWSVVLFAGTAHAIEVRHQNRYSSDLSRAYAPCLAPNTTSSTGLPACVPAVTSVCSYNSGAMELRQREDTTQVRIDLDLNDVSGPGNCPTGPYTLKLGLRVSVDDGTCASGSCTLTDVEASVPLVLIGNDFELNDFTLESALPGLPPPLANYELLHAYILAPDGQPIAGAGTEDDNGADLRAGLGVAYAACTSPDTANAWSVSACSAPVWQSPCDFGFMEFSLNRSGPGPRIQPRAFDLTGVPASCADGLYAFVPTLRITTDDCGARCTLVDLDVPLFVNAVDGVIPLTTLAIASDPTGVGVTFVTEDDDLELVGLTVLDPLGNLLAANAVTPTLGLGGARVNASYRAPGNPTDDLLIIKAAFPHPPLDPTIGGATFAVTGKSGPGFTATLPAGAWTVRKPGRHWVYRDELGTINGVRTAEIREFSRSHIPTGFKVRLTARATDAGGTNQPALTMAVSVSGTGGTSIATDGIICRQSPMQLTCK